MATRYGWVGGGRYRVRLPLDVDAGTLPQAGDALKEVSAGYYGKITGAGAGQIRAICDETVTSVGSADGDCYADCIVDDTAMFEYPVDTAGNLSADSRLKFVDMQAVQTVDENAAGSTSNQVQVLDYDATAGTVKCRILFSVGADGRS